MGNRVSLGVLAVLLSAFGFGMMPLLAVYAYAGGASVPTVLFVRFALAALFFFALLKIRRHKITMGRKQLLVLFLMGGIFYTAMSTMYFLSVKFVTSSVAALMLNTYPIFVALMVAFLDKEKIGRRTIIAIVLAMTGMILVLGTSFGGVNLIGVSLALGAGVIYSAYIFVGNRLIREIPPLVTTAFVTLFTACTLLISGLAAGQIDFHIELQSWIASATLAFFSTILSIFLQLKGLELIGTTRTSVLSLFEPIVAIILSALFLHDALTFTQLIGAMIVVSGGVLVVAVRDKNKEKPHLENAA
ncbi:MAG: DMT family transporter [Tumebacillaceae bacterium]